MNTDHNIVCPVVMKTDYKSCQECTTENVVSWNISTCIRCLIFCYDQGLQRKQ